MEEVKQLYPGCVTNAERGTCNNFDNLKVLITGQLPNITFQSIRSGFVEASLTLSAPTVEVFFSDDRKLKIAAPDCKVPTFVWFSDPQACKAAYDFILYMVNTARHQHPAPQAPYHHPSAPSIPTPPSPSQYTNNDYRPREYHHDPTRHHGRRRARRYRRYDDDDEAMEAMVAMSYYAGRDNTWRYSHRQRDGCCVCCNGSATSNDSLFDWLLFMWCVSSFYSPEHDQQTYSCCNTVVIGDLNCCTAGPNPCGPTSLCESTTCDPAFNACDISSLTPNPCSDPVDCGGCAGPGQGVQCTDCACAVDACDVDACTGCVGGADLSGCNLGTCDAHGCDGCGNGVDLSGCDLSGCDVSACDGCSGFDLGGLDLSGCDLSGLDLSGCADFDIGGC